MLRAILTSHVSKEDLDVLSLQVNGTLLGQYDPEQATNRVVSGNREVHLAAGYYSTANDRSERKHILEQKRLFDNFFSDIQTLGLAALPELARKYNPEAAFLLIASADMVLIWQDRQKGAYLLRGNKFYRLQPTPRPTKLWPEDWMTYGDFYAFVPETDDFLIFLSADFIDHFNAEHLEEIFSSHKQMFSMMATLNDLGRTYGFDFEQSWMSLQIQRLEVNRIYKGHADDNLSEEVRRISRAEGFSKAISRSKVSRVLYGQELIPAKENKSKLRRAGIVPGTPVHSRSENRPHLGEWQAARRKSGPIDLINEEEKQQRDNIRRSFEARRDPRDQYFEKVREFQIEPVREKINQGIRKFFNIWPEQKFFSRFFASSLIVLVVLIFALSFKLLSKRRIEKKVEETTSKLAEETADMSVMAEIPQETNLEIVTEVKVNNLQIRQSKDSTSTLIASVKRGETVIQLTPEIEGWIYVRTEDGIEGYVFAEYLNP